MYDIIVVGGGPAGLTAALYAARAGKSVLVLEQETLGGQIAYAPLVENYPGLPGMRGGDFADQLARQVREQGAQLRMEGVSAMRTRGEVIELTTDGGTEECLALVLATGVSHRKLGLAGEADLVGAGLSYCAVCDGAFYQGRPVAVVGGGDAALQEALFLSQRCAQVTVIHRRDLFRGEQRLVDQLRGRDNVDFRLSSQVTSLLQANGELTGLRLADRKRGTEEELKVDGLFVAVGQESRNEIFANLVMTDDRGYFVVHEDCATSLPGVFAAGDCRAKEVRQLTTAVGDGAVAGLAACRYVDQRKN